MVPLVSSSSKAKENFLEAAEMIRDLFKMHSTLLKEMNQALMNNEYSQFCGAFVTFVCNAVWYLL